LPILLIQNWEEDIRAKLEPKLQSLEISSESFELLLQILKEAGDRIDINKKISNATEKFIEQYIGNSDIIYLIARISKNYLNKHSNTVGWAYVEPHQRPRVNQNIIFDSYRDDFIFNSPNIDEIELLIKDIFSRKEEDYNFIGYNFFKDWLRGLYEASILNIKFKFEEGGLISNPEANDRLGKILEELKKFK